MDRGRLLGAGSVLMASWIGGTVAGTLGGSALGDPADYGLDAMFPALFLALLVGQLDGRRARVAALAGGADRGRPDAGACRPGCRSSPPRSAPCSP